MAESETTLYLLCGKIASGKSTLSADLAKRSNTIIISEDTWLSGLYPGEINSVTDYMRCSRRLRDVMAPHIAALLKAGTSIVLDFPANTISNRTWMRGIIELSGARHELHYLDVPDDVCKARLRARNASGTHEFAASDAEYGLISSYFLPPTAEEGFHIVVHDYP